ncbi:MAG: cytochrome C biogenesis protein CcdA [Nitrospirae bacterium RIFCSPHIGHO2_02_FULL_42_12]|nr:MAG: cytochrome C biogenesis protein CcdA [Nitrospirae bacterium RIFCSPHIGHO2_02_FULL_42_12]
MEFIVILITAGSVEEGEKIANALVESRLAACANIIPSVRSIFFWEGKTCQEQEVLLVVKSRRQLLEKIIDKVKQVHSYKVPEIIALPVIDGSREYLKWVEESTS